MNGVADRRGELALADRVRRRSVHHPADLWVVEGQPIKPDQIIDMDPAEPLAPVSEPTSKEHSKRQDEQSERRRIARQDEAMAKDHDSHAEWLSLPGRCLPRDANLAEVAGPGLGRFIGGLGIAGDIDI